MALISLRQLLDHAAEHTYGVPAFNVNNLEQMRAIMLPQMQQIHLLLCKHRQVRVNMQVHHSCVILFWQQLKNGHIFQW
jgi:fructose/tagatose bisphosphate aldolase